MRGRHLGSDLGLLGEGLRIGHEYGFHSLEEMAAIAWYLERSVYERGSLRVVPGGIAFDLRNPPLRMGAFQGISLSWDGAAVPAPECTVHPSDIAAPLTFDSVTRESPLVLRPGNRIAFTGRVVPPSEGPHTLRLELRSLAIPPMVWFQLTERVRAVEVGDV